MWITQSCNPFANSLSIPHDQTILCYLTPLLSQLLIKGAPFHVILMSWLISAAFIVASVIYVKGWPELWTILYSLFFLYLVTEIERLMRISFLQNNRVVHHESNRGELQAAARNHTHALKKVANYLPCFQARIVLHFNLFTPPIDHANENLSSLIPSSKMFFCFFIIALQVKYELQIVSLQAEKDKHEIESERARLRSLIGNVAHDLKTPLQSIGKTALSSSWPHCLVIRNLSIYTTFCHLILLHYFISVICF